jgi:hypothetical protein
MYSNKQIHLKQCPLTIYLQRVRLTQQTQFARINQGVYEILKISYRALIMWQ